MSLLTRSHAVVAGAVALSFLLIEGSQSRADNFVLEADVGGGVESAPLWEGATRRQASVFPLFKLHALTIPGLISISGRDTGFSVAPSVRVVRGREEGSDPLLHGLGDVSTAYELGGKLSYRWEHAQMHVEVRQGFGGHSGVVGEVGADVILRPADRVTIEVGPRAGFASDRYMQTYFGVDGAQAIGSAYATYDASAGFKSVGVLALARWEFTPSWSLVGRVRYDKLIGDAGASPLVAAGSVDQVSAGLGLTYRLRYEAVR